MSHQVMLSECQNRGPAITCMPPDFTVPSAGGTKSPYGPSRFI